MDQYLASKRDAPNEQGRSSSESDAKEGAGGESSSGHIQIALCSAHAHACSAESFKIQYNRRDGKKEGERE